MEVTLEEIITKLIVNGGKIRAAKKSDVQQEVQIWQQD